eukprot:scaffold707_cov240-Pinguiococcus_pyrenoidosus.AAC.2
MVRRCQLHLQVVRCEHGLEDVGLKEETGREQRSLRALVGRSEATNLPVRCPGLPEHRRRLCHPTHLGPEKQPSPVSNPRTGLVSEA